jgi:hypothetical protein
VYGVAHVIPGRERRAARENRPAYPKREKGCYAERMIETAVPLESEIELNGALLALDGITE